MSQAAGDSAEFTKKDMEGSNKVEHNDVVIVSAVRTRFGRSGGSLRDIDYYERAAIPMREVVKLINLDPKEMDEVI